MKSSLMRFLSAVLGGLAIGFLMTTSGCGLLLPDPPCDYGDIDPVQCVEDLALGMSQAEVAQRIGAFDLNIRADGAFRAWEGTQLTGDLEGVHLFFLDTGGGGTEPGPLDMISMRSPYEGTTPEGIGIGATVQEVRDAYGDPDREYYRTDEGEQVPVSGSFVYCFGTGKRLGISFDEGTADLLSLSYYKPPPEEYRTCD